MNSADAILEWHGTVGKPLGHTGQTENEQTPARWEAKYPFSVPEPMLNISRSSAKLRHHMNKIGVVQNVECRLCMEEGGTAEHVLQWLEWDTRLYESWHCNLRI